MFARVDEIEEEQDPTLAAWRRQAEKSRSSRQSDFLDADEARTMARLGEELRSVGLLRHEVERQVRAVHAVNAKAAPAVGRDGGADTLH